MKRITSFWLGLLALSCLSAMAQQAIVPPGKSPKAVSSDLRTVSRDIQDAEDANAAALHALGQGASASDIEKRATKIRAEKYGHVKKLMLKDTSAYPNVSILWSQLGLAEAGLNEFDQAEASYKKALTVDLASSTPSPVVQGLANAGLGELYARIGKIAEARNAYDAAAKANPAHAALYLRNEAIIFYQLKNVDAQVAAANEAIMLDPDQPILYYLKGNGLAQKASKDSTPQQSSLSPECIEAFQKYLQLAPNGPYAAEVKKILGNSDR